MSFDDISGFAAEDHAAALAAFRRSAAVLLGGAPALRPALPPPPALLAACRAALTHAAGADPQGFFRRHFAPRRLSGEGFVTAYYEPQIDAALEHSAEFYAPVLARPADLVTLNDAPIASDAGETLTSARRRPDGALEPFPQRRAIEAGEVAGLTPIAFVRDWVELFLLQVQGSATLRFSDGALLRLTYDGRNGWPYSSVGRALIEAGHVAPGEMTLDALKKSLRALGLGPDNAGRRLMQRNRSYVFFKIDETEERRVGPIGGAGCALTPLRAIAVDRSLWPYGLPFFLRARLPWESAAESDFARLMIAQDTGSAILGQARADLYFGSGPEAGALAGSVRHAAEFFVLEPRAEGDSA